MKLLFGASFLAFSLALSTSSGEANTLQSVTATTPVRPENPFFGNLEPAPEGGSFTREDHIVWGGSVIRGEDGRYYMFASSWPESVTMRNWVTNSEIVLAVSDSPEGPFTYENLVLPPRGSEYWDGMITHNPSIHRHDGKYVLFYVGSTYNFERPTEMVSRETYEQVWNGKRIGVAVADSPYGPWTRFDQPILEPRPGFWDGAITSNPAPVIHEDGSALLVYKSAPVPYPARNQNKALDFGVAEAPHYLGPYHRLNNGQKIRIAGAEDERVEDPYIWQANGLYHMVAKIFSEKLTGQRESGFYAYSVDGIDWTVPDEPTAYDRRVLFTDGTIVEQKKLERPQVLVEDGRPTHLYFATADPEWAKIYNLVIPVTPGGTD